MATQLKNKEMATNYKRLIFVSAFGAVAIAFSFINILFFANKSCGCGGGLESETYVSSMNRAQQAYFLEKGTFLNSIVTTYSNIPSETKKYRYFSGFVQKISIPNYVIFSAKSYSQSKQENRNNYFGVVWTVTPVQKEELAKYNPTTYSILCKSSNPNLIPSSKSQVEFSKNFKSASCPKGMELIK